MCLLRSSETSRSSTAVRGSEAYEVELRYREGREFLFVCKLLRAAEFEAKRRAKQTQFATAEVDLQEILPSHAPIQAPPNLVQFSAPCIGNLLVDHETLVFLHLAKFKAVRAFEDALTKKGQLLQVFPLVHLKHRSEEESGRLAARALEIAEVYAATVFVSRSLIDQVEMVLLPVACRLSRSTRSLSSTLGLMPLARAPKGLRSLERRPRPTSQSALFAFRIARYRARTARLLSGGTLLKSV